MRIVKRSNYNKSKFTDDEKYDLETDKDLNNIFFVLQGRIRFGSAVDGADGENIAGQWQVVADTGLIDTAFTVNHTIGSIPVGYLVIKINKAGVIYDSGTAWTSTHISLKCSIANATITLFLVK